MIFEFGQYVSGKEECRDFSAGEKSKKVIRVSKDCQLKEYGFITEENRGKEKVLQIPELNSGFSEAYWCKGETITQFVENERGIKAGDWKGQGMIPLTFAMKVIKEGNYFVKIKLQSDIRCEKNDEQVMIFLGRRRLAYVGKVEDMPEKFVVNVTPIIPRGYENEMKDETVDVTIVGKDIYLSSIEISKCEIGTIYIAGDSTVTDQNTDYPYLPEQSYCGWGQMLSYFVGTEYAISNHSHSGLTTESFRSEGHYRILKKRIKKGDICLLQFGHNDQKLKHLDAQGGYRKRLCEYVEEIQDRGAEAILVTPLARNSWRGDDGSYNDLLNDYAKVCIELSKELGIKVIDLHQKSMDFVKKSGCGEAKKYYFPSDYTHSNDYGAYLFASYVYEEWKKQDLSKEQQKFVPPMQLRKVIIPEEYQNRINPNEEKILDNVERKEDALTRVEALEFAIKTMHFFPINVYNDMFEDVLGHETYAGTVECASQNGLILQEMITENHIRPKEDISFAEFICIIMNAYKSRMGLPESVKELSDIEKDNIDLWMEPYIKAAKQLDLVEENECAGNTITRERAAKICRNIHI